MHHASLGLAQARPNQILAHLKKSMLYLTSAQSIKTLVDSVLHLPSVAPSLTEGIKLYINMRYGHL